MGFIKTNMSKLRVITDKAEQKLAQKTAAKLEMCKCGDRCDGKCDGRTCKCTE